MGLHVDLVRATTADSRRSARSICLRKFGAASSGFPRHNSRKDSMSFRRVLGAGLTALIFMTVLTGTMSIVSLRGSSTIHEAVARDFEQDLLAVERLRSQAEHVAAMGQRSGVSDNDMKAFRSRL